MDQLHRAVSRRPRSTTAIALLVAVALVAFSAAAALAAKSAPNRSYNGPAGNAPGAGVEFGAHVKNKHPVSVFRFEYHNIPAQCQGSGTTATTDKLDGVTMKLNAKRKFGTKTTLNGGKVTVKVHGRFSKDYSKVSGTLRVQGTVPGCRTADTGVVNWHA
jgi:hypothetical protein